MHFFVTRRLGRQRKIHVCTFFSDRILVGGDGDGVQAVAFASTCLTRIDTRLAMVEVVCAGEGPILPIFSIERQEMIFRPVVVHDEAAEEEEEEGVWRSRMTEDGVELPAPARQHPFMHQQTHGPSAQWHEGAQICRGRNLFSGTGDFL